MNTAHNKLLPYAALAAITLVALILKLQVFSAGAPYVTIDDYTLYEAGFLVWFGEAPPQRMYFESWIVGASSMATYVMQLVFSGNIDQLGLNLVADAYRSFLQNPDDFVKTYRALMLLIDLATAWLVFLIARQLLSKPSFTTSLDTTWLAVFAAGLYLLSYNTIWCYVVARPDTVTAFFAALGIYYYYRSNFGEHNNYFYLAAIALGCATGFKLHAALFVVFFILDLIRQLGFITAIKRAIPFGIISVFLFAVVAGSPLFDPLLYVKLRALNIKDDASPWIQWGEQFVTVLRGTGWLIVPALFAAAVLLIRTKTTAHNPKITSLIFVSCLFVLFFLSIRQLRAYWMLPALPLFYVACAYLLGTLKQRTLAALLAGCLFIIFGTQSFIQSQEFDKAEYAQLKNWVKNNVQPEEVIYIIGYDTLFLPCNTTCLKNRKASLERMLAQAISEGEAYTHRHIRQWEERAQLQFIDMLDVKSDVGFNYYGLNGSPLATLTGLVEFSDIKYALVLPGYSTPESEALVARVKEEFTFVTSANAPGGKAGTGGLPYDIYVRKE